MGLQSRAFFFARFRDPAMELVPLARIAKLSRFDFLLWKIGERPISPLDKRVILTKGRPMTAQIINMEPEVEAAIREGRLTQIEITEARMKLADGVLSLKASDLLPPKIKTDEEVKEAKTAKERQREFVQRRKDAGFKKDWLHESLLPLAEEAGGQENIAQEIEKLRQRAEAAEQRAEAAETEIQRLKARRWWRLWR